MSDDPVGISQSVIDEFVGVSHGDYDRVKAMLEQRPELVNSVASWNETPIEAAAQMANRPLIELLLQYRAPLEICTAVVLGRSAEVTAMLDADPGLKDAKGAHGLPLMWYPAITGDIGLAELLVSRGANVNAGAGGNTALHAAAIRGHAGMIAVLLEYGADPSALDYEGKTALDRAREGGHDEAAAILGEQR